MDMSYSYTEKFRSHHLTPFIGKIDREPTQSKSITNRFNSVPDQNSDTPNRKIKHAVVSEVPMSEVSEVSEVSDVPTSKVPEVRRSSRVAKKRDGEEIESNSGITTTHSVPPSSLEKASNINLSLIHI